MGDRQRMLGQVLQDTYRIEKLIGKGGMGAVYEASHLRLDRRFAIKMLFSVAADHPNAFTRFKREAKITSGLGHPHILDVIDFNHTPDGDPYIVMELLDGENLAERIKRQGPLEIEQVASILRQTASALQAAHDRSIIHRDLKPPNIFLCNRGERDDFVKVVDFGISKVLDFPSALTKSQGVLGSPFYLSPEQAEERAGEVGPATDIYAMGTIVYEMLAGTPPFVANSVPALVYKIVHQEPRPLRSMRPDLPQQLELTVGTALQKRPEDRYRSMAAFWSAFSSVIEQEGLEFYEPTEDRQASWTRPGRGVQTDGNGLLIAEPAVRPAEAVPPGVAIDALAPTLNQEPDLTPDAGSTVEQADDYLLQTQEGPGSGDSQEELCHVAGDTVAVTTSSVRPASAERTGHRWWIYLLLASGLVIIAATWLIVRGQAVTEAPLRLGIVPYLPQRLMEREFGPLVRYLERRLDRPIDLIIPETYDATIDLLLQGKVDIANLTPLPYLVARHRDPGIALLAMVMSGGATSYESYLVVRRDDPARELADLRGRRICFVDPRSTSGYLVPRVMVRKAGFDPASFFGAVQFSGNHYQALRDLLAKRCTAAAVYSGAYLTANKREIQVNLTRILKISERLPFDVVCSSSKFPSGLLEPIRRALLELDVQQEFGMRAIGDSIEINGFTAVKPEVFEPLARELESIEQEEMFLPPAQ